MNLFFKNPHLLFAIMLTLFAFSCQKEESSSIKKKLNDTTTATSETISHFDLDVKIENGLLHFKDAASFYKAMENVSDNAERHVSDEVLNDWEDRIGFKSMRYKYSIIQKELWLAEDDSAYAAFKSKYGGSIFDENGSIQLPIHNEVLASLLNEEGKVLIDGDLYFFMNEYEIIILKGDESKLADAKLSLTTDKAQGVFVIRTSGATEGQIQTRGCGDQLVTLADYYDGDDKKLSAKWELSQYFNPRRDVYGQILGWDGYKQVYAEMKSEKKNVFNNWVKHEDDIWFYTDYEASGGDVSGHFDEEWLIDPSKDWKLTRTKHFTQFFSNLPTYPAPGSFDYVNGGIQNENPSHPFDININCY